MGRLLKQLDFRLRVNHKKLSTGSRIKREERNEQFAYIARLREQYTAANHPAISVDTKKRELIGQFKNPGRTWESEPVGVYDHDFRSDAVGVGIPYGVYDQRANHGCIFLGTSYDTPGFAVDSIETWWRTEGCDRYPRAKEMLIIADGGGSNSSRARAWKSELQYQLADRHGLTVTVSHYPPGASKWNPIEHRFFSEVSKNWAGKPLDSYETVIKYIRQTKTDTGLTACAHLVPKQYEKGVKISEARMNQLRLQRHATLPQWNYTLRPCENRK